MFLHVGSCRLILLTRAPACPCFPCVYVPIAEERSRLGRLDRPPKPPLGGEAQGRGNSALASPPYIYTDPPLLPRSSAGLDVLHNNASEYEAITQLGWLCW